MMRKNTRKTTTFLFLMLGILVLILGNLFPSQRRAFFFFFFTPAQKTIWQAGESLSNLLSFSSLAKLREENKALWFENQSLKAEIAELKDFAKENERLKEALDGGLKKEFSLLPVRAIALSSFEDVLFLDKGTRDGVKKGMPIISSQKVLYGFVEETFEHSSRARLISHPESSVIVIVAEDRTSAVLKGKGERNAILDLIPRDAKLKDGDLILTSPQENYPKGLLVGLVGKDIATDIEPFLQRQVQLFFKEAEFRHLFVITDF